MKSDIEKNEKKYVRKIVRYKKHTKRCKNIRVLAWGSCSLKTNTGIQ